MLEEKKKKFRRIEKKLEDDLYKDSEFDNANILKMPNTFNLLREKRKYEEKRGRIAQT